MCKARKIPGKVAIGEVRPVCVVSRTALRRTRSDCCVASQWRCREFGPPLAERTACWCAPNDRRVGNPARRPAWSGAELAYLPGARPRRPTRTEVWPWPWARHRHGTATRTTFSPNFSFRLPSAARVHSSGAAADKAGEVGGAGIVLRCSAGRGVARPDEHEITRYAPTGRAGRALRCTAMHRATLSAEVAAAVSLLVVLKMCRFNPPLFFLSLALFLSCFSRDRTLWCGQD